MDLNRVALKVKEDAEEKLGEYDDTKDREPNWPKSRILVESGLYYAIKELRTSVKEENEEAVKTRVVQILQSMTDLSKALGMRELNQALKNSMNKVF